MISGDAPDLFESHGRGQLALLKLRGPAQMSTPVGRSLFFMVANRASHRSLIEFSKMPLPLKDMSTPEIIVINPLVRIQELLASSLNPMTEARNILTSQQSSPDKICMLAIELLGIDADLETWWNRLPDMLLPKIIKNSPDLYLQDVDSKRYLEELPEVMVFYAVMNSGLWSRYATGRIQLLRIIQLCLAHCDLHGFDKLAYSFEHSTDNMETELPQILKLVNSRLETFVNLTCATSPYLLGKLDPKKYSKAFAPPVPPSPSIPRPPSSILGTKHLQDMPPLGQGAGKALGAFFLMWNLYPAGLVTNISERQHEWIEDQLLEIGTAWGIKQGLVLRQNLKDLRGVVTHFSCFPA
jgi:hypothetical protein